MIRGLWLIWCILRSAFHLQLGSFNSHLINPLLFFFFVEWCNLGLWGAIKLIVVSFSKNLVRSLALPIWMVSYHCSWCFLWWVEKFDHLVSCLSLYAIGMFRYDWCYVLPRTPLTHDLTKKARKQEDTSYLRYSIIWAVSNLVPKKRCQFFLSWVYFKSYIDILSYWCQLQDTSRVKD